jgi:hypothetical protein
MPGRLPSGFLPTEMSLKSTACASTSFCVSVGSVDDGDNSYPLVETYSGGVWTASLASTPPDRATIPAMGYFKSVSCPADGQCAAVGIYYSSDGTSSYQAGLLGNLSDGSWTTTEAPLPESLSRSLVTLYSVSCPSVADCSAVGYTFAGPNGCVELLYLWSASGWQLASLPVPSTFNHNDIQVYSIACADVYDCVAVGYFQNPGYADQGLILTLAGGTWTASVAPLPANAATPVSKDNALLNGVDCPQPDYCVAVGNYGDSNENNVMPLLEIFDGGTWTAAEGPVPTDDPTTAENDLDAVSCPVAGECVAAGSFGGSNGWTGMILTQNGATWSAADAPLAPNALTGDEIRSTTPDASTLVGVGCDSLGLCAASGTQESDGLLEVEQLSGLPELSRIAPQSGHGGTVVTVDGANFTPDAVVAFGGRPATSSTYISSDEIRAVAPQGTGMSNVSVTVDGLTNRASSADYFDAGMPTVLASSDVGAVAGMVGYYVTLGGVRPSTSGSVKVSDGRGRSCRIALKKGGGTCSIMEPLGVYTVSFSYPGGGAYRPNSAQLTEGVWLRPWTGT